MSAGRVSFGLGEIGRAVERNELRPAKPAPRKRRRRKGPPRTPPPSDRAALATGTCHAALADVLLNGCREPVLPGRWVCARHAAELTEHGRELAREARTKATRAGRKQVARGQR